MLAGVTFLRQGQREERFSDPRGDGKVTPKVGGGALVGVRARWVSIPYVPMQWRGGVGGKSVKPGKRWCDGRVAAEVDATGVGDVDDLANGARGQVARLGHRPPDADRYARRRSDAAHRGDEDEFRPERVVDAGRNV